MNLRVYESSRLWMLGCGLALSVCSTGCLQTSVGGQTLPSAYFLEDDVQYFPAGPETKLANQIRALERYKLDRQIQMEGTADESLEQ